MKSYIGLLSAFLKINTFISTYMPYTGHRGNHCLFEPR